MKKWFLIFTMLLFILPSISFGGDIPLQFAWDVNGAGSWTELRFFQRGEVGEYNYSQPSLVLPQTYLSGVSSHIQIEPVFIFFMDDQITTKYFVVRAYNSQVDLEPTNQLAVGGGE